MDATDWLCKRLDAAADAVVGHVALVSVLLTVESGRRVSTTMIVCLALLGLLLLSSIATPQGEIRQGSSHSGLSNAPRLMSVA
jgi:hypothetical protein